MDFCQEYLPHKFVVNIQAKGAKDKIWDQCNKSVGVFCRDWFTTVSDNQYEYFWIAKNDAAVLFKLTWTEFIR